MQPPALNLPSLAIPWGRWVQDQALDAQGAIERQINDAGSIGSQFASRADSIGLQLSRLSGVSSIQTVTLAPYSVTRFSTTQPFRAYDSPVVRFNAPTADGVYSAIVIANMTASTGVGQFSYCYSLLRAGGYDFSTYHENDWATYAANPTFSIAGNVPNVPGALDVQCAIAAPLDTTATFTNTSITCIFTGATK